MTNLQRSRNRLKQSSQRKDSHDSEHSLISCVDDGIMVRFQGGLADGMGRGSWDVPSALNPNLGLGRVCGFHPLGVRN